jgi:Ca2+-binding RTX toxin-like protein
VAAATTLTAKAESNAKIDMSLVSSFYGYTLVAQAAAAATGKGSSIVGSGKADIINGGSGVDTLSGGAGNDTLEAKAGADSVNGGLGNDTFKVSGTTDQVALDTITGGGGTDTVSLINSAAVTATFDLDNITDVTTFKTLGNNAYETTLVFSEVTTSSGETITIDGSNLVATNADLDVDASAVTNANVKFIITGGSQVDTLKGGAGADTITGGAGSDLAITGGLGADVITGGAGDSYEVAQKDSTSTAFDTIISYATGTEIGSTDTVAATESVSASSGVAGFAGSGAAATFNAADDTLAERIAAAIAGVETASIGNTGHFQFGDDAYIVIGDAVSGVTEDDVVIKLANIDTTNSSFDVLTVANSHATLA